MKSIVYNSDCLIALREMPDKAFDLAIVDPPYGIKADATQKYQTVAGGKFISKHHGTKKFLPRNIFVNLNEYHDNRSFGAAIIFQPICQE